MAMRCTDCGGPHYRDTGARCLDYLKGERERLLALVTEVHGQRAAGEVCAECDEDGLIYCAAPTPENPDAEMPDVCPVCDGTRLGVVAGLRAKLVRAAKALRALLLFYAPPPWHENEAEWKAVAGDRACTSRSVCDMARDALRELSEEEQS